MSRSAPDDEEDPRNQRQHRQHEALVLKREVEQVDEGVQEEPEAEQAKAETANRRVCHGIGEGIVVGRVRTRQDSGSATSIARRE